MSFRKLIESAVNRLGECSTTQVLADVGANVSASNAATTARRDMADSVNGQCLDLVDRGRKRRVADVLGALFREGKIRRVGPGRYAPLEKAPN